MNLNMIRSKTEIEDFLLSIFKNCETFLKQTHTKPEETLDIKLTESKRKISFQSTKSD